MEWEEIWQQLSLNNQGYPEAAIQAVLATPAHQERMLIEFERVAEEPDEMAASPFVLQAMHVLAQCREKRALQPMLRVAALPSENLDFILGDILTESFAACLASVCGDERFLQGFVENPQHDQWARNAMLDALTIRIHEGDLDPAPICVWAIKLAESIAARLQQASTEESDNWTQQILANELLLEGLADLLVDTGSPEVLPHLQRWGDADLLDINQAGMDFYQKQLGRSLAERADERRQCDRGYIRDAAAKLRGWACFSEAWAREYQPARIVSQALPPMQPIVKPPKIGRNDPCPCGSGKKYKKCCAP